MLLIPKAVSGFYALILGNDDRFWLLSW